MEYEADTRGLHHNNELRPAIGAKLLLEGGIGTLQIGAKAVKESRFLADEVRTYGELFLSGA